MKKYRDLSLVKKGMNIVTQIFYKLKQLIPDKVYLNLQYKHHLGKKLNLGNPQTFNEKLQWLKLYDRNPEYTMYVDKYAVREHIKNSIGEEYLIPLIGVYNSVEEIDWDELPDKFVLKCTHGSQCNIICSDKSRLNIEESKAKLKKWMNRNWFWYGREWPYKNVKPRIICEKYMVDESGTELKDYKVFCFNGTPRLIQVDFNRFTEHRRNLYDTNWNQIDGFFHFPSDRSVEIAKPKQLNTMLKLAENLAVQTVFSRIDFYLIYEKIYFGEITLYPESGFGKFSPSELDSRLGSWITLPEKG